MVVIALMLRWEIKIDMEEQLLILVDEQDNELGVMDKLSVHEKGLLHRAFSVFIFNTDMQLLLQQRSEYKYHSAGVWSNTCCSHPRPGEKMLQAINRRLKEEMGMECNTVFAFNFIYRVELDNGLTEHEYDHVYIGISNTPPIPTTSEVKDWKYMSLEELKEDIAVKPQQYTEWLKICLPKIIEFLK